jgi:hypothetical protein
MKKITVRFDGEASPAAIMELNIERNNEGELWAIDLSLKMEDGSSFPKDEKKMTDQQYMAVYYTALINDDN